MQRFSKTAVAVYLDAETKRLQTLWNFDPNDGWDQATGKGDEFNRAYGEYVALVSLGNHFDLRLR